MTIVEDILTRLAALGCRAELTDGGVAVVGPVEKIPAELTAAARRSKPALIVELLRQKAWTLRDFLDGDAPLSERLAKTREYQETTDRLTEAQEKLFQSYQQAGFSVVWSGVLEEFILVGGKIEESEDLVSYTWKEIEALKEAGPEQIRKTHLIKKAFSGKVFA